MRGQDPITLLVAAGLGATAAVILDPVRGRRRRHVIQDRAVAAVHDVEDLAGKAKRDIEHRTRGLAARLRGSKPSRPNRRHMLAEGMPVRRLLTGGAGALASIWGLARGGLVGAGGAIAGAYLLARAAVPYQHGMIRVEKTLTIHAPIERVFEFWSRFENFPRFMEHVLDVRSEGDRSHWRVTGPLGLPIEWDAEITEQIENRKIAWSSLADSAVNHHGEVHFERLGDNATRLSVHMSYMPPGGPLGHAVAGFLLGDPKMLIDDDLVRFKSLMEQGKATARGAEFTVEHSP